MLYRAYLFIDKDPTIDLCRTAYKDAGEPSLDRVHNDGGPTPAAVRGWFTGKTRRPQVASVRAFLRALGYDLALRKAQDPREFQASDRDWIAAMKTIKQPIRKQFIKGRRANAR